MKIANMPEYKSSSLLTAEENDVIFSLLGQRCQTLATTVVELYSTGGRDSDRWYFKDIGVLCLVKDNGKRSYFFRIFCLTKRKMIWEHEIYNNINYEAATPYLHTFEAEDCIVGFNFADDEEGKQLRSALLAKLEMKKQRRERRSRTHSANNLMVQHVPPPSYTVKTPMTKSPLTKPKMPDRKKDGKKLTKADIGTPHDFKHVSHVGWNANTGFEIDIQDPQLKQFFAKAGVSESQLKDEETRQFIYNFIEENGGMDAVKGEVAPAPPIPSRGRAPPPPPSRTPPTVPPPPPPPPIRTVPPRSSSPSNDRTTDFKPPPPPPPPIPAVPPLPSSMPPPPPPADDPRSALMEAIRSGPQLKPLSSTLNDNKKLSDSRGELLDQIRQGIELKPVAHTNSSTTSSTNSTPHNGLAGALARALAERSKVFHSDSSDTSGDDAEDEEEWDD